MNLEAREPDTASAPAVVVEASAAVPTPLAALAWWQRFGALLVAVVALGWAGLLWQKLSGMQEQLARQSAQAMSQSEQARALAQQAQELAVETSARLAVTDARFSEIALQRTQLEELMQSLSRSRDENLVVDIEAALRLAQQQAQLTGSVEPLLAALKSADQRITRAAQPRLTPLQRAMARDLARIKGTAMADTPALLVKLDELVALTDDLPLGHAVGLPRTPARAPRKAEDGLSGWWGYWSGLLHDEVRSLIRVSRVELPDSALLSPEQGFFVRENLKLKLLNARLGLLARQLESARSDLGAATLVITRYFDPSARKTQTALGMLQQVRGQMRALELPRIDDTLTALATAAAGR